MSSVNAKVKVVSLNPYIGHGQGQGHLVGMENYWGLSKDRDHVSKVKYT